MIQTTVLIIMVTSHLLSSNQGYVGGEQCSLQRITHFRYKNHTTATGQEELGRTEGGKLFRIDQIFFNY